MSADGMADEFAGHLNSAKVNGGKIAYGNEILQKVLSKKKKEDKINGKRKLSKDQDGLEYLLRNAHYDVKRSP